MMKDKSSRRAYNAEYYRLNKSKQAARSKVSYALRLGTLTRPICCGKCGRVGIVEAHHKDYNKPLEVEWLCPPCHRRLDFESGLRQLSGAALGSCVTSPD